MIVVKDMTKLFYKQMLIYALSDISFKKPLRVAVLGYFFLFFAVWSLPLLWLLFPLNPYTAILVFGPPIILGNLASQPIWGNKRFFRWITCQLKFLLSKKRYYDGYGNANIYKAYIVKHNYMVSRRKDYQHLASLLKEKHK